MQTRLLATLVIIIAGLCTQAQSPTAFWNLSGNSDATSASKLGTTGATALKLYTNNVQRMVIGRSTGNVGIGTNNPIARLHVYSTTGVDAFRVQVNGNTKLLVHNGGGVTVGANITPPANGLYVSGNVGLGIASSALGYKLHVGGKGRFTGGVHLDDGGLQAYNSTEGGMGVYGFSDEGEGYGIYGSGFIGVHGNGMIGVDGSGYVGLWGTGIYGVQGRSSEGGTGVYGQTSGAGGYGVRGYSSDDIGVYGQTDNAGSYAGYFEGNVYSTGSYVGSDRTLKQDIEAMSSALSLISKLRPKSYTFRQDGEYKMMNLPTGIHYGLIAQDVEEILPNMVKATTFKANKALPGKPNQDTKPIAEPPLKTIAFKAVNYTELIPIIIKGMQELEAENKRLKEEISRKDQEFEQRLQKLEAMLKNNNAVTVTSAYLEQNSPNPVSGTTSIRYHIPETSTSARLTLTNAKGQVVKTINLSSRGAGLVNLTTSMLAAGTYNYTLHVDGKQAGTKRLIIIK